MAKNNKKEMDLKVFQSNKMTLATYNFTANQKNIIYKILVAIKTDLVKENLLGDKLIYLEKKELLKYRQDVKLLKADLRAINHCVIEYTRENGDYVIAGVINDSTIKARVPQVEIIVNKKFIEFARHFYKEFTAFNLTLILSLKGAHAKRIYEICCMYKNLGQYKFSLLELKKMLCVENKYKHHHTLFGIKILEPAKKRINACAEAEVSFDYEFEKENREVFVVLKIKNKKKQAEIQSKKAFKQKQKEQEAAANDAYYFLERLINDQIHDVTQIYLDLQTAGKLEEFAKIYKRRQAYYEEQGRNWADLMPIMLKILKEDFGIDLKNYNYKLKNKKPKDAPKTHPNPEMQRQINFLLNKNKGNIACVKCETRESKYYYEYRGHKYCTGCYEALQNQEEMGGILNTIMENRKVN